MSNSESSDKKQSIDDGDISCVPITPHIDRHVRSFPKDKDSNVKTEGERVTKRCQDIICVFLWSCSCSVFSKFYFTRTSLPFPGRSPLTKEARDHETDQKGNHKADHYQKKGRSNDCLIICHDSQNKIHSSSSRVKRCIWCLVFIFLLFSHTKMHCRSRHSDRRARQGRSRRDRRSRSPHFFSTHHYSETHTNYRNNTFSSFHEYYYLHSSNF